MKKKHFNKLNVYARQLFDAVRLQVVEEHERMMQGFSYYTPAAETFKAILAAMDKYGPEQTAMRIAVVMLYRVEHPEFFPNDDAVFIAFSSALRPPQSEKRPTTPGKRGKAVDFSKAARIRFGQLLVDAYGKLSLQIVNAVLNSENGIERAAAKVPADLIAKILEG